MELYRRKHPEHQESYFLKVEKLVWVKERDAQIFNLENWGLMYNGKPILSLRVYMALLYFCAINGGADLLQKYFGKRGIEIQPEELCVLCYKINILEEKLLEIFNSTTNKNWKRLPPIIDPSTMSGHEAKHIWVECGFNIDNIFTEWNRHNPNHTRESSYKLYFDQDI